MEKWAMHRNLNLDEGTLLHNFKMAPTFFSFLKIMKKLNLRNYIDEDKERSYTVEGTLFQNFKMAPA